MKSFAAKFAIFSLLAFAGCNSQKQEPVANSATGSTPTVSAPQIHRALDEGAAHIVRATKSSGEFVYLDSLDSKKQYKPVYNVLRHAGTLYALGEYHEAKPNPEVKAALVRAAKWLKFKYIHPVPGQKAMLAVWALPSDRAGNGPTEIKLGGVGLGLAGLLQTEKVAPNTTSLETLRLLGNCALWMQKPDGNFYSKYDAERGGMNTEWQSLYYPGETALGLTMLAERDPDPKLKARWLNAAARSIGALAREREGAALVPADHWALIATARLWPLHAQTDGKVSKATLARHARQICKSIVDDPALQDERTTPIATRMEGLLAAQTFLPRNETALHELMDRKIEKGVKFLLETQIPEGELRGGMPQSRTRAGAQPARNADELRIDYIQHAMSAWLGYARQNGLLKN